MVEKFSQEAIFMMDEDVKRFRNGLEAIAKKFAEQRGSVIVEKEDVENAFHFAR